MSSSHQQNLEKQTHTHNTPSSIIADCMETNTQTYTHTHTPKHTNELSPTNHIHTHTHTHTHTYTHIHTHMHTHQIIDITDGIYNQEESIHHVAEDVDGDPPPFSIATVWPLAQSGAKQTFPGAQK